MRWSREETNKLLGRGKKHKVQMGEKDAEDMCVLQRAKLWIQKQVMWAKVCFKLDSFAWFLKKHCPGGEKIWRASFSFAWLQCVCCTQRVRLLTIVNWQLERERESWGRMGEGWRTEASICLGAHRHTALELFPLPPELSLLSFDASWR